MKIHMVKKGDTLYEIAKKHNVDLEKLIASNPQITNPDVIEVGMKVKIPNEPKSLVPPTDYLYKHKVVQGDSLWKLSKAWNVPLQAMITANPQLKNPNILMTGEFVYIPKVKSDQQHPQQHHQGHHQAHPYHPSKPNTAPLPVEPTPQITTHDVGVTPSTPIAMPTPTPTPMPTAMPEKGYEQPQMPTAMPEKGYEQPQMPTAMPEKGYEQPQMPMPLQEKGYEQPQMPIPTGLQMPYMPQQPPMMPYHEIPAYPYPEEPSKTYSEMQPFMPEQEPYMNLFQQYQQPAAEVFTPDYTNLPQHSMWAEPQQPTMYEMPFQEQLPYQNLGAMQPVYPMYQQQHEAKDCGCGGPVFQSYDQAVPYPYATHPYATHPYAHHMHDQTMHPVEANPYQTYPHWPAQAGTAAYGDMPCYTPSYDPLAMTSAYPGTVYPGHAYPFQEHPAAQHYYGFPYAHEKPDCGCGCHDRAEGEKVDRQKIEFKPVDTAVSEKEEKAVIKNSERKKGVASHTANKSTKRSKRPQRSSAKAVVNAPWLGR